MYEPTCGTGGFLTDAMNHVDGSRARDKIPPLLIPYGQELEPETHAVGLGSSFAKRTKQCWIAKLDRLARNVHSVSGLMATGIEFVAADMPQANKTMIQMQAVMSEWERDEISKRTSGACRSERARVKPGNPD